MAGLRIENLAKRYGARAAVDGVSLELQSGAFATLLGPSGCGKTTLLRLIAGLDRPSSGTVTIGNRVVAGPGIFVEPEDRGLGMVFQSYALWPHMTVAGNVSLGLEVRGMASAERMRRIEEALAAVGLDAYGGRRPSELSGGQRQRVALARCLALKPPLILLDEPLANLDAHLRDAMQAEFRRIHKQTGTTFVHVTHDQAEAMALADTIAVMSEGRLQQVAPPQVLYAEPATAMVAGFVGHGTLLPVEVLGARGAGRAEVRFLGQAMTVRGPSGRGPALLCVRSENLRIAPSAGEGFSARVGEVVFRGAAYEITAFLDGLPDVSLQLASPVPVESGRGIRIAIGDGWVLPAEERASIAA